MPDSPPHGCSMGQETGEKGTGAVDLQPTIPKSDRLLGPGIASAISLKVSGILPSGFEAMAAVYKEAQEADGGKAVDVDHYFDTPLNAAKEMLDFKHDKVIPDVDYERFDVLLKASFSTDQKPWWCVWKWRPILQSTGPVILNVMQTSNRP